MLKHKMNKIRKKFLEVYPEHKKSAKETKEYKYSLDDWTLEDIRKVVFPEGRDIFDPDDKELEEKWYQTKWIEREFLDLLSVDELKALRDWLEKEKDIRGLKG